MTFTIVSRDTVPPDGRHKTNGFNHAVFATAGAGTAIRVPRAERGKSCGCNNPYFRKHGLRVRTRRDAQYFYFWAEPLE